MNTIDLPEAIRMLRENTERRREKVSLQMLEIEARRRQLWQRMDELQRAYGPPGEPALYAPAHRPATAEE